MSRLIALTGMILFLLCPALSARAAAADAEVRYVVTNGGADVEGHGLIEFYRAGHHDGDQVTSAYSGGSVTIPEGHYDVHVTFSDGAAQWQRWFDNQAFAGQVEKTVEVGLKITEVRYVITNGGSDVEGHGLIEYFPGGNHDGAEVSSAYSGGSVRMPEGSYDVHVTFADGAAHRDWWIDNQAFVGQVEKTAEVGLKITEVRYVVTNNGTDVEGHGLIEYFPAGNHNGTQVTSAYSGGSVRMPEGSYDVHVSFADGSAAWDKWFDNQAFAGKVERKVEVSQRVAEVRYVVTNNGTDVEGHGLIEYLPAGHHNGAPVTSAYSGGSVRVPEGSYDVHVSFSDGSAAWDKWFDNQAFAGKVERKVEVAQRVAEVRYVITNSGTDVEGHGLIEYFPAGNHDGTQVTSAYSGGYVRVPEGSYDVHVTFADGAAHKDWWIDNQAFAGKVGRSVEVGLAVADVTYTITNGGTDLKGRALVEYFPAGHHDGDQTASAYSGGSVRIPDGRYAVHVAFAEGFVRKDVWIENQAFTGKLSRAVELNIQFAEPTVAVTQNGADVEDKARVAYVDPATHDEVGSLSSGETAKLATGTYDVNASLFGSEGWLRAVAIAGRQHLTIDIKPLKTEALRADGPPPTACVIEVYGVNFDFDKAVLRPEAEPVLKQVLALFTRTPAFSAEVGGHTDNVGTPDYNLKLSDARAAAVKAWLMEHGVAVVRVMSHGYGDTRPLVPNTTDDNRSKNRRVELRTAACR